MEGGSPLIVSLMLDEVSSAFFNRLRQTYFPPAINYLSAHLTLFHHLPPGEPRIQHDLQAWSAKQPALTLQVTGVKSIGKGAAYALENSSLLLLHRAMQEAWGQWLTPQDKQRLWPHITVQNKVRPEEAQKTVALLQARFTPFSAVGRGFQLWAYEGGPWRRLDTYLFQNA